MAQATQQLSPERPPISEDELRLLIDNVTDYAIIFLDPEGRIVSWSGAAERIKGYRADDVMGKLFPFFYPPEDVARDKPGMELREAAAKGRYEDEGWRVRKDGSRFWANVIVTALRDKTGRLRGF